MLPRLAARRKVADFIHGRKDVVKKGEIFRRENRMADKLEDHMRNPDFGFRCLHYSVSEGCGQVEIIILNKNKAAAKIGVRTVDGDAKEGDDYEGIDKVIEFTSGQADAKVHVPIKDDEDWEPDEDFYLEIYNPETGKILDGEDIRCTVTIIDDDKPGMLVFETRNLKVIASEGKAVVKVLRQHGSDGRISCHYTTMELDDTEHTAVAGKDFEACSGVLEFEGGETTKEIIVKILARED